MLILFKESKRTRVYLVLHWGYGQRLFKRMSMSSQTLAPLLCVPYAEIPYTLEYVIQVIYTSEHMYFRVLFPGWVYGISGHTRGLCVGYPESSAHGALSPVHHLSLVAAEIIKSTAVSACACCPTWCPLGSTVPKLYLEGQ